MSREPLIACGQPPTGAPPNPTGHMRDLLRSPG